MRYADGMVYGDIGETFGLSGERIRQIEREALVKMLAGLRKKSLTAPDALSGCVASFAHFPLTAFAGRTLCSWLRRRSCG
jgi:hypothetical protein